MGRVEGAGDGGLGDDLVTGAVRQHGEAGRAQGRARFARLGHLDGNAERAGKHGGPSLRSGAAAGADDRSEVGAGRAQRVERVAQRHGDAFHDGAGQILGAVSDVEVHEGAAHGRVVVGRALAREVGEEEEVAGRLAGGHARRQVGGRAAGEAGEPVERVRGREDHAHLVPAAGHGVAEGVDGGGGLWSVAVPSREQDAGGAQGDEPLALAQAAEADGGGGVVSAAARDRDAGRQAEFLGDLGAERAGGLGAFDEAGHLEPGRTGGVEQNVGPSPRARVEPSGAGGVRHL